jgi:hypothetical protein
VLVATLVTSRSLSSKDRKNLLVSVSITLAVDPLLGGDQGLPGAACRLSLQ